MEEVEDKERLGREPSCQIFGNNRAVTGRVAEAQGFEGNGVSAEIPQHPEFSIISKPTDFFF